MRIGWPAHPVVNFFFQDETHPVFIVQIEKLIRSPSRTPQAPNKTLSKGFKPNETSYSLLLHYYSKADNVKGIKGIEKEIYDGHVWTWGGAFLTVNGLIFRFGL